MLPQLLVLDVECDEDGEDMGSHNRMEQLQCSC